MQPITCNQCGTTVLAEKYSAQHTSVQWLEDAASTCPRLQLENASALGDGKRGTTDRICPALHATIDQAVRDGALPVTRRAEPVPGRFA
ncbi:hypothetical protein [Tomitella fengzijianii]|uniref:Ferredoxin n=1 Tax=Tomitella fengzijianii TaxID=2597660 RepID=A0A516WZF6_9ACTN|nr:hypothetical protein [Tomitella fengzijianii]QDQ96234.1 hypothetical protein FO059_01350 [Tomitella fengzijianii]